MKKHLRLPQIPKWVTFAIIFLLFLLTSIKNLDPDLGWHIKSGEYFANGGSFLVEPFTYTASEFPFIDHEWLSNIFVFFLDSIGGHILLSFVFATIWTLAFYIISHKKPVPGWLLVLAAIGTLPFAGVRFVALSVLCLATLFRLYESRKGQYFIPLLLFFWANIHGSFIIGIFVFLYLVFYDYFLAKTKPLKSLHSLYLPIGILTASVLLTFINPYGPRLYEEIFRQLFDTNLRYSIAEWASNLYPQTLPYLAFFLFSVIATFKPKDTKSYLAPENIFLLAAFWSQRHWPLFLIMSPPHTASRLHAFFTPIAKQLPKNRPLRRIFYAIITGTVIASTYILYSSFSTSWDRLYNKPTEAVAYLEQTPCSGNLFNEYNDGGYLIKSLPSHKVYIDGRMPSWSDGDTLYIKTFENLFTDSDLRKSEFKKYNIKCALVFNTREQLIESLESEDWIPSVQSEYHTLLLAPT